MKTSDIIIVHPGSEDKFEALKAITGIDPVVENDMGNLPGMVESWLDCGSVNGYIK